MILNDETKRLTDELLRSAIRQGAKEALVRAARALRCKGLHKASDVILDEDTWSTIINQCSSNAS